MWIGISSPELIQIHKVFFFAVNKYGGRHFAQKVALRVCDYKQVKSCVSSIVIPRHIHVFDLTPVKPNNLANTVPCD